MRYTPGLCPNCGAKTVQIYLTTASPRSLTELTACDACGWEDEDPEELSEAEFRRRFLAAAFKEDEYANRFVAALDDDGRKFFSLGGKKNGQ